MSSTNRIYFPGLNALRFFAAYFVLLHHGETIRAKYGMPNLEEYSMFRNGSLAVSFFFVLSGFLITYLLLDEINKTQNVSIKKFYIRRVLRIWPLYFLLVFVGLVLIPLFLKLIHYDYQMPYDTTTAGILFTLFLSFVVNSVYGSHLLEPLWSIGVEEYFYLVWAPLFKFFKNHVWAIIISVLGVKTVILVFYDFNPTGSATYLLIKDVLTALKFELMAIGGMGAHWVFKNKIPVAHALIFKPSVQVIVLLVLIVRLFFHQYCMDNQSIVYAFFFNMPIWGVYTEGVLFLWLILNVSLNPRAFFKLTHPILDKLGEISYGIYMYQMLVIFGTVLIFKKMMLSSGLVLSTLFFYSFTSCAIIGISWLSKRYFEDIFLRFR